MSLCLCTYYLLTINIQKKKCIIYLSPFFFDEELAPRLPGIFGLLRTLLSKDTGLKYIETLLKYILSGTESVNEKDLASALKKVAGPKGEEIVMTAAEKLIQIGMEKGIQQGIQQGMQQGMQLGLLEGIVQTIEFTISAKFGDNDLADRACRIIRQINDLERLDEIKKAIKEAETSKDLLARLLS